MRAKQLELAVEGREWSEHPTKAAIIRAWWVEQYEDLLFVP